jgi:hypothetical protein
MLPLCYSSLLECVCGVPIVWRDLVSVGANRGVDLGMAQARGDGSEIDSALH